MEAGGLRRLDEGASEDDLDLLVGGETALDEILSGTAAPEAEQGTLL